jgi:hypothetical protein
VFLNPRINFGKWAFQTLLPEPARFRRGRAFEFEIESFFPVFCLRTEKIIAWSEERLNFVRRLQRFPISPNRFFEAFFALETIAYISIGTRLSQFALQDRLAWG